MQTREVKRLLLGLTNMCNARCIMCWHSNRDPHKKIELSQAVYEEIRDKLFGQIVELNLAGGGEILMYPRIEAVFRDISKYRFKTILTSNFSIISERYRNLLKDMNVEFVISLDGSHKQLQESLRPNCDYDKIIDTILFFKKHRKKMMFQTTISDQNFYDMESMLRLAEDLGIDAVKFQEVHFLNNLDRPFKIGKPPADTEYLDKIFQKRYKMKTAAFFSFYHRPLIELPKFLRRIYGIWKHAACKYCPNTKDMLKIQEDGEILSCCLPYSKRMGNLYEQYLESIIGDPGFDRNRELCTCPIRTMLDNKRDYLHEDAR